MAFITKTIGLAVLVAAAAGAGFAWWAKVPIVAEGDTIPFTINKGSGAHAAGQQIA